MYSEGQVTFSVTKETAHFPRPVPVAPQQAHASPVSAPSRAHSAVGACKKPLNAVTIGEKATLKLLRYFYSCWASETVSHNWLVSEAQRKRKAGPGSSALTPFLAVSHSCWGFRDDG